MSSFLRETAYKTGLDFLPEKTKPKVEARKELLDEANLLKLQKSRHTKNFKKENPNASPKEITESVTKEFEKDVESLEKKFASLDRIEHMFDKFQIIVWVFTPTARTIDPPNLAPTTKNLIDGLTDCGFWEDDNWTHLRSVDFRYGGQSGIKDNFKIVLDIIEIPENNIKEYDYI